VTATLSIEGVKVCSAEDVPLGEGRTVAVGGRPLAVFRTSEGFFALDNTCTHMGGPLADGIVAEETVACPLHDRRFQLATGRAVGHQCGGVAAYPVEERDGEVFVTMPMLQGIDADESPLSPDPRSAGPQGAPVAGKSPAGNAG